SGAARGGAVRLARQRRGRRCAARLALENLRDGARHARTAARLALVLARLVGVLRALARALLGLAFGGRRKVDAGASRLREPDRDRLPRRARAVFAAPDFPNLLVHELARLGGRRLALALVLPGFLDRPLVGRGCPP